MLLSFYPAVRLQNK